MSTIRLVLIPAALTLVITVVRLLGELNGWSARWFSAESGGAGALVGIGWLIPVFGAWFGWRLARGGAAPAPDRSPVSMPLVGLLLAIGVTFTNVAVIRWEPFTTSIAIGGAAWSLCALFVLKGWPRLFGVLLLYGLLARAPVVVVTWFATRNRWGTHYEKVGPASSEVALEPTAAFLWSSLAQLALWVPLTILAGGLFGGLASKLARRR